MRRSTFQKMNEYAMSFGWQLISPLDSDPDSPLTWTNGFETAVKRFESIKKTGFAVVSGNNQFNRDCAKERVLAVCKQNGWQLMDWSGKNNIKAKALILDANGRSEWILVESLLHPQNKQLRRKIKIQDLKDAATKKGGLLISGDYLGIHAAHEWQCENGHQWTATANSVLRGGWCPACANLKRGNYKKLDNSVVMSRVQSRGYSFANDFSYVNAKTKLKLVCSKNHVWSVSLDHFMQGNDCPACFGKVSKAELSLLSWVQQYTSAEKKVFKVGDERHELDIYIPEHNFGIEYNGLYWHSEASGKDRNYHLRKNMFFQNLGIQVLHVFEDEWNQNRSGVQNLILSRLSITQKIYARKCNTQRLDRKDAVAFFSENHIQGGNINGFLFVGCFFENVLVGAMSFGMHHRGTGEVVLNRMAFQRGITVVGGASKMLNYALDFLPPKTRSIISWSDNSYSSGNVYKKIGFHLDGELPPDYSYLVNNRRVAKQKCTKKRLKAKGAIGNTEKEMASYLKYYRIWDCGKKRWVFYL